MERIRDGGETVYNTYCDGGEGEAVKHFLIQCKM